MKTLLVVAIFLMAFNTVLMVFTLFWLKRKFQEAGSLFLATKAALEATQTEKDLTQTATARAMKHVTDRAAEMGTLTPRLEQAAGKLETVAANTPSMPTVLVPTPIPVVVVEPHEWKPGDPERRHEERAG